ncbi:phosphotransferase [Marivita sp. GX14005]|uniref:aminoglycoside phosphotransferase family protein n=1 Tax=Marivita sp. GX14005 TaxID=2942276 RepID=UPI002019AFB4|nr:phosphotransferase [Marivita sp. GX14005]MCL3881595.1 phosphotransferase [Marivita sp. GX14005]
MNGIEPFLEAHGWAQAQRDPLAGDASSRRYVRLRSGETGAILMVDPADDTARFARIADHLLASGLSAPRIIAQAPGLMLIEDFGDAQFARAMEERPAMETPLYRAAVDVLAHLDDTPPPQGLVEADAEYLGGLIEPLFTDYIPALGGNAADPKPLTSALTECLAKHLPQKIVLILRDFHAENMIWLPQREGVRRVGLLDFQDALAGPPVYDLVSMLQDARRDVTAEAQSAAIRHYAIQTGREEADIQPLYHLLGLQRNLRILGIFARLARTSHKPAYLRLIPRVWAYVQTSLNSPVAVELAPLARPILPEPTQDRLQKAATCPTP